MAAEIEGNTDTMGNNSHMAEERGLIPYGSDELDEEDKHSSVLRSAPAGPATGAATLQISRRYYIHPQVNILTKHV